LAFLDDYIKVFKKNKEGLAGRFKIVGQVTIGLVVGLTLYFNDNVVVREVRPATTASTLVMQPTEGTKLEYRDVKSMTTTVPFFKNNEFSYSDILPFLDKNYTWIVFTLIVIVIITAVSNGANITDGIDGLAAGTSAIIGLTLAIFAYLSGRVDFSSYLNIMYIPNLGELVIFLYCFCRCMLRIFVVQRIPGSGIHGRYWKFIVRRNNCSTSALAVRKELMIPLLCGIFLIENLSVIVQVSYFKYTKKKYGEGRRILLMSPLHHHYQKKNIHEAKIVTRFWIVGILLAILSLAMLKLR
jgi:phospho-N-acetylmuramoyl-pentapeptide-transferase